MCKETYLLPRKKIIGGTSSEQRGETRPKKAPRADLVRREQRGRREDRREHSAPHLLARREHSCSTALRIIFDRVGRSAGDVDREQGRDLCDRLRHSRKASPSSTSIRSANQPRCARLALAELDELRARIEDFVVRAEEVGDDNHSPFTREIKEEPLPHGFKMP